MRKKLLLVFLTLIFIFPLFKTDAQAATNQLIIINKKTNQLAYYEGGALHQIYSVGTGRSQTLTPEGTFKIVNKIKNRPYYTGNVPGGSPKNPLGDRWLGINARGTWGTTYAIHGNNDESSIGKYVSAGCVRMHNAEIRQLFDRVQINTPVIITTSSNSFEAIAASNGFYVGPPSEKYEKVITLLESSKLYQQPAYSSYTGSSLAPQTVQAYEKAGNFIKIKTWAGPLWVYTDNYVEGKFETVNSYITLFDTTLLWHGPSTNSGHLGALAPQTIYAYEKVGNWYKVKTWAGPKFLTSDRLMEGKLEPFNSYITLFGTTNIYNSPNHGHVGALAPQTVYAYEKIGNWYKVNTWAGPKFLPSDKAIAGTLEALTGKFKFDEPKNIYINIWDTQPVGTISPQEVETFEKINNYYHIRSWLGDVWVK